MTTTPMTFKIGITVAPLGLLMAVIGWVGNWDRVALAGMGVWFVGMMLCLFVGVATVWTDG